MLSFRILGPVEAAVDGRRLTLGGRRQLSVLALLLLNANRPISSDELIEAMWGPDRDGASARLQMSIARLRRALEPVARDSEPVLRTVSGGYLLAVGPGQLDAQVFERQVQDGLRALDSGHPDRASQLLRAGLELSARPAAGRARFRELRAS